MPARPSTRASTRERLRVAATDLFARHGFHGTTIRDIADTAHVNVAAAHYHYGSKRALYLEVLRAQFADVRARFARRGARLSRAAIRRCSRAELAALLETRIGVMLDVLIGPPPGPTGALMQREMCDPSAAMPIIVAEFIDPQTRDIEAIVRGLAPRARAETVRDTAFSIVAQTLFYRYNMPAVLALRGWRRYPPTFARRIARHITTFSLAGLEHTAASRRELRRAS